MATSKSPKKQSKSDFIRSQPATMSASEVVAKAKGMGVKLAPAFVYQVRGRTSAKAAKSKSGGVVAPKSSETPAVSKADFIRSLAKSSAKEVVTKAKAAGISLSENHVHAVRANDKARATKKKPVAVQARIVPIEKILALLKASKRQ